MCLPQRGRRRNWKSWAYSHHPNNAQRPFCWIIPQTTSVIGVTSLVNFSKASKQTLSGRHATSNNKARKKKVLEDVHQSRQHRTPTVCWWEMSCFLTAPSRACVSTSQYRSMLSSCLELHFKGCWQWTWTILAMLIFQDQRGNLRGKDQHKSNFTPILIRSCPVFRVCHHGLE